MVTSGLPPSTAMAAAVLLAAVMGLALQRGATCTVAAVAELVTERRATLRLSLLAALFAGALAGGLLAGLWQARLPSARALVRCFGGGLLMGCGSLLIPGGIDGLFD